MSVVRQHRYPEAHVRHQQHDRQIIANLSRPGRYDLLRKASLRGVVRRTGFVLREDILTYFWKGTR